MCLVVMLGERWCGGVSHFCINSPIDPIPHRIQRAYGRDEDEETGRGNERGGGFRRRSDGNKGEGVETGEEGIKSKRERKRGSEKLKQFGAAGRRCTTQSEEVNQGQREPEREGGELCAGQTQRGEDDVAVHTCVISVCCFHTDYKYREVCSLPLEEASRRVPGTQDKPFSPPLLFTHKYLNDSSADGCETLRRPSHV